MDCRSLNLIHFEEFESAVPSYTSTPWAQTKLYFWKQKVKAVEMNNSKIHFYLHRSNHCIFRFRKWVKNWLGLFCRSNIYKWLENWRGVLWVTEQISQCPLLAATPSKSPTCLRINIMVIMSVMSVWGSSWWWNTKLLEYLEDLLLRSHENPDQTFLNSSQNFFKDWINDENVSRWDKVDLRKMNGSRSLTLNNSLWIQQQKLCKAQY